MEIRFSILKTTMIPIQRELLTTAIAIGACLAMNNTRLLKCIDGRQKRTANPWGIICLPKHNGSVPLAEMKGDGFRVCAEVIAPWQKGIVRNTKEMRNTLAQYDARQAVAAFVEHVAFDNGAKSC